jgi:branched-chain amino acid aminotransferase
MDYINIDQNLLPENQALISVKQRACRFGDGIFETCKVVSGIIYNFEAHLMRIEAGLKAIKINFDITNLKNSCYQLIKKNNLINGSVRISISRGLGSAGYLPLAIQPLLIIETDSTVNPLPASVDLWQSSYTKISAKSLPINYKLSQGLNSTLAMIEARENNCFDALMLNDSGQICEAASANIFWIKDEILYTPADELALLGTTRDKIISLSELKVKKVMVRFDELILADEIFITNSRIGTLAVARIMPLNKKISGNNKNSIGKNYSEIFKNLLNQDIFDYVKKAAALA